VAAKVYRAISGRRGNGSCQFHPPIRPEGENVFDPHRQNQNLHRQSDAEILDPKCFVVADVTGDAGEVVTERGESRPTGEAETIDLEDAVEVGSASPGQVVQ